MPKPVKQGTIDHPLPPHLQWDDKKNLDHYSDRALAIKILAQVVEDSLIPEEMCDNTVGSVYTKNKSRLIKDDALNWIYTTSVDYCAQRELLFRDYLGMDPHESIMYIRYMIRQPNISWDEIKKGLG